METRTQARANPLIQVLGIQNKLSNAELIRDIATRNQLMEEEMKLQHVYGRGEGTRNAKIQVTARMYAKVMETKRLFVGYQRLSVRDDFNLRKCWKCNGYGHNAGKNGENCRRQLACGKCAGAHETKKCNDQEKKECINCIYSNKFSGKKKKTDHAADDTQKCETYQLKLEARIASTNYPYQPRISALQKTADGN